MRIVQFITRMDVLGGAQMHVLELTRGLKKNGHELIVISSGYGKLTDKLQADSIDYYPLKHLQVAINPIRDLLTIIELRKLLKTLKPDLIAIHSSKAGIIGRLLGKSLNIPTVFTAHSWSFSNIQPRLKRSFYIGIEKLFSRLRAGIITVSYYDEQLADKYLHYPSTMKKVIHNGVADRQVENNHSKKHEKIQLIMVARFAYPKDHEILLNTLAILADDNWHLTLAGDGPLKPHIEELAETLNLEEHISFLGEVNNVATLLDESDIFLLPSQSEGLPISIIEAMRAQLAIIATDVGGVSELIDHQQNGLLIKPEQMNELIFALSMLMKDLPKRMNFAYQARKKFEQEFTYEMMLEQTIAFYEQTIKYHFNKRKVGD